MPEAEVADDPLQMTAVDCDEGGLLGGTLSVSSKSDQEEASLMLHAGLDLSRRRLDVLVTAPRFGWINAFTVASEIGNTERFSSPTKLCGYTGLCPRVIQSGNTDRRGPREPFAPAGAAFRLAA